ncbi:hypothetical protein PC129_g10227 [Phytophthora cactorum]|uniref:Uncharacterized protein n=1 Tax=Phytophthora cactorum TaxID=29920 RepID=A0A329SBT4_9STRA|nr:hypothetical protein Pcac1_g1268 [Phytophthora cactorum]KAG2809677.1 hypothetical protein PC112_g16395 [Phytophthora cactorum]KAG2812324.1 hypothetical protein PC111_g14856 [Phytophthora cactorum]KAG2854316.1 hypothetical protein PC113_g13415 [Phytophthora cactorum]KAG2894396.1 hypothetical protein PC114_g15918 [Phytophthora cactorum]
MSATVHSGDHPSPITRSQAPFADIYAPRLIPPGRHSLGLQVSDKMINSITSHTSFLAELDEVLSTNELEVEFKGGL